MLGLFGADWFYLSCGDAIFISIGLNKLLASSIAILLMCHMSGWCVVYLSYQTDKKTVLAILRIRINFGSQKVNSAFFLFALCEKILPFYLSDDSTTHCDTGCYFVAISWWWFDYTRLSTGHWERSL